ncbi:MAG: tetratricopeptide repeat protein, partial [Planctomycetota bacterium]
MWKEAIGPLQAAVQTSLDRSEAREIHLRLADCYLQLERFEEAEKVLNRLLGEDPSDTEPLANLERALTQGKRWEALAKFLERKLQMNPGTPDRETNFRLATIYRDHLEQPLDAAACFEKIAAEKSNPMILAELQKIYEAHSMFEELAQTLERSLEFAQPQDARAIQFRLGRMCREQLGWTAEGARWIAKALGGETADPQAIGELENAYRDAGPWEDLLYLLRGKADDQETGFEKSRVLLEIGRVTRDHLLDPVAALPPLEEAFDSASDPGKVLEEIEKAHRASDQAERFAQWLADRARAMEPSPERNGHLKRAAEVFMEVSELGQAADLLLEVRDSGGADETMDEKLAQVLESAGRADDLAALLEDQAKVLADPEERLSFLLKRARLFRESSGREPEAEEAYRSVLEIRPDHIEALSELADLLRSAKKYEELLKLYSSSVELASDREEVATIHLQAGRLLLEVIRDPVRATERFKAALLSQEGNLEALRGLVEAARGSGDRSTLLDSLSTLAELEPEVENRLSARMEQASLVLEEGGREEASALFEEAVALDPTHVPALKRLDSIYADLGRHHERASALERLSAATQDREGAASIQKTLGALYRDTLEDMILAAGAFERGLAISPGSEEFLLPLEGIYASLGRDADRIRVLEDMARTRGGERGVELLLQASSIAETTSDSNKALSLLRSAREYDPKSKSAHLEAARILRTEERWEMLVDVLSSAFQKVSGAPQTELAREIGQVKREKLGDPEGAIVWFKEVHILDPEDDETLSSLSDLLEQEGRMAEAVDFVLDRAGMTEQGPEKARLLVRAATLLEESLGRREDAIKPFAEAVRMAPGAEGAIDGLRRCAESLMEWDLLAEALETALSLGDERGPEYFESLCVIHETKRLDLEAALSTATLWREAHPHDPAPLRRLASLFRRLDRPDDMLASLQSLAGEGFDQETRTEALLELSRVRLIRFSDPRGAQDSIEEASRLLPQDRSILEALERFHASRGNHEDRGDCIARLIALAPDGGDAHLFHYDLGRLKEDRLEDLQGAKDHFRKALEMEPCFLQAVRGLQRLAEREEDLEGLARLVEQEIELAQGDQEKTRGALLRLAALRRDSLEDEEGAIRAFMKVAETFPGDLTALHGLENLYSRREEWEELGSMLRRLADLLAHERDRRNAWFRLGLLLSGPLARPEEAIEAFDRALKLDPNFLPCLRKLQDTYEAMGRASERLEVIDREITMDIPSPRKLVLLRESARGWGELGERKREAQGWRRVVEALPGDTEGLNGLEFALEELGELDELQRVLDLKWNGPLPREERLSAGLKRAALLEEELDRHEEGRDLLRSVLEQGPADDEALQRYRHLCERTGDHKGLAWCLDREIEGASDPGRRFRLLLEAGSLRLEKLADPTEATTRFESAWALYPQLHTMDGDLGEEEAFSSLRELYTDAGRLEDLVQLLLKRAQYLDGEARGETYGEAARHAEEGLKDDLLAARTYHVALEFKPDHREALRGLSRLLAARGMYGDVVTYRLREVSLEEDRETRVELLMEVASIHEQNLQDLDQAAKTYARVLDEVPGHHRAFEGLVRLLPRLEKFRELAEAHARQARVDTAVAPIDHSAEAGRVYLEKLDDPRGAIPHLKKAFEADPKRTDAAASLSEALRRVGDMEELARVKEEVLSALPADDPLGRLTINKE